MNIPRVVTVRKVSSNGTLSMNERKGVIPLSAVLWRVR